MGILLVDTVLGHGSHADPAGALADAVRVAAAEPGRPGAARLCVVASVTGTDADPQRLPAQVQRLRDAGIVVAPCNASAARVAARLSRGARRNQRLTRQVAP